MILSRGYRNPVLLLHPLGGWTKADDVPLKVPVLSGWSFRNSFRPLGDEAIFSHKHKCPCHYQCDGGSVSLLCG